jgi:hypothetical protein
LRPDFLLFFKTVRDNLVLKIFKSACGKTGRKRFFENISRPPGGDEIIKNKGDYDFWRPDFAAIATTLEIFSAAWPAGKILWQTICDSTGNVVQRKQCLDAESSPEFDGVELAGAILSVVGIGAPER